MGSTPLSIYTHLPFREERCLYCACNVVISRKRQVAVPYLEWLKREIELDPRVTTEEDLEALAARGFNRMSLGVQDFDPDVQKAVNRIQSIEETRALMVRGRALAFTSLNLDLIYGRPHQTVASFSRTMEEVVALRPDRLAVYSFALVPGSSIIRS